MRSPFSFRAAGIVAISVVVLAAVGVVYGLSQSKQQARRPSTGLSAPAGAVNKEKAAKNKRLEELFSLMPEMGWNPQGKMPLQALQKEVVVFASHRFTRAGGKGPRFVKEGLYSWYTKYMSEDWQLIAAATASSQGAKELETAYVTVGTSFIHGKLPKAPRDSALTVTEDLIIGQTTVEQVRELYPEPDEDDPPISDLKHILYRFPGGNTDYEVVTSFNSDGMLTSVSIVVVPSY